MAEQRQLIYKILLEAGNSSKDAKKLAAEIDKVTNSANAAAAANQKMGEAVGKNSEVIFGSINHLKNQISGLKQQRDAVAVGGQEFTKYNNKIATLESQLKQASAATDIFNKSQKEASVQTKELAKLQTNQARSAGLAGAASFELGRTISDLPFGLVAISNNVSQLGTLFAALVANAGGFSQALKLVKQQLAGPAGILIAFQVVIAAITYFKMVLDKAERSVSALAEAEAGAATNLKALRDALEMQTVSLTQAEQMVARANKEYKGLNLQVKDNLELTTESKTALDDVILSFEKAAKAKAALTLVEQLYQEQIEKEIFLEKLRTDGFEGFTAIYQGFLTGLAGGIVMPELGKQFRIDAAELSLRNVGERIKEVLATVGTEGLADKIFGPEKDSDKGRAERTFFPFLSDDQLKHLEQNIDKANEIAELQERLALARIKIEENRLKKELKFIDAKLQKEEEGSEKFLKLQIKREAVLDSLSKIAQERDEENAERAERLRQLDQELMLASISDEQERLRQKILFLDEEMAKEAESTENYKELQLKKIKAVNALAKAEERLRKEQEKSRKEAEEEDNRVNALRAKLFAARIEGNVKLEKKWVQSQIDSLNNILNSEKINKEQRAQAELDLFEFKRRLIEIETQQTTSAIDGFKKAVGAISDILSAQAERDIAIETNRTTAVNDQLRQRLANEQLNAEQRDKINQQISRNDADLVGRQNEIAKKQFERDKAFKIAIALGDTASSALRAYASQIIPFDPTSVVRAKIAAGLATAFGLAQVAALTRLTFTQKALPSPNLVSQGSGQSSGPSFNVVGSSTRNQLAEAVSSALSDKPIKTFVVSSDVSSAQELDRKIIEGASI